MTLKASALCALVLLALTGSGSRAEEAFVTEDLPRDAALSDSSGKPTQLSRFRKKPLIFFYEDKHSVAVNRPFKLELYERGKTLGLLTSAHFIAVANLHPYDFFPARPIALSYVRDEERRVGVPILVDFKGRLSAPPWDLPATLPSVVVLDAKGRVRFRHSGAMTDLEIARFYEVLGELLGMELARAPAARQ